MNQNPDPLAALFNRAMLALDAGRPAEAVAGFDAALRLAPRAPQIHGARGLALMALRRPGEALAAFDAVVSLEPNSDAGWLNRAAALLELGRPAEALASQERAIALTPADPTARFNRAKSLEALHRPEEALADLDLAIALDPGFAAAHFNRAVLLHGLDRLPAALVAYDRAIALNPASAEAHNNRGALLQAMGRHIEALASFDRAARARPDYVEAIFNRGVARLLRGDLEQGWPDFEARVHRHARVLSGPPPPAALLDESRRWRGEPAPPGTRMLVHSEQGFGDTLQFARFLPLLRDRGLEVMLAAPTPLRALLAGMALGVEIIDPAGPSPTHDRHCPIMSLPLALGVDSLAAIPPSPRPVTDPARRARMAARLGPRTVPRIGLAWSGNPGHRNDRHRSIAFARLAPLLAEPAEWIALQTEIRAGDAAAFATSGRVAFHGDALADFADTAALIDLMDLVITVDTSLAHLAGAMGKPVWILLPFAPDWRWMLERADSPWYPGARLFRQPAPGDWESVVAEARSELARTWPSLVGSPPIPAVSASAADLGEAEAHEAQGLAMRAANRRLEALASFERAVARAPGRARSHGLRGVALLDMNRPAEALASLDTAVTLDPIYAAAFANRGVALEALGRLAEALESYDRAIAAAPDNADARHNSGVALRALGRPDEALLRFDHALALDPAHVDAHAGRAATLTDLGRPLEAIDSCERALALAPAHARARFNLGVAHQALNRLEAALAAYGAVIASRPDHAEAHFNTAICLLLLGRGEPGWREFEWRGPVREPAVAPLDRSAIAGASIFVRCEQGFGDIIQFWRYLPLLTGLGARVSVAAPRPLWPLMAPVTPGIEWLDTGDRPEILDRSLRLMSLPLALGATGLEVIPPSPRPRVDPDRRARLEARLGLGARAAPRIGLAWSGNPDHPNDRHRSVAFARLGPLLAEPADWIAVQTEIRPADAAAFADSGRVAFLGEALGDFADTAALIDLTDLVITVDTSVAHLAGVMGKPVWILLPFAPDWRWRLGRADSPWYPSARLFRQPAPGDWESVVAEARSALRLMADLSSWRHPAEVAGS